MPSPLKIDLRQLNTFVTVASTGSFSRAAEKLFTAQPALSRQIRLMEEALNTEVFVRHGRGVALTAAGELLYVKARSILQELERTQASVSAIGGEVTGQIVLGILPTASPEFTGSILAELQKRYPQVKVAIKSAMSGTLQQLVAEHRVDLAVSYNVSSRRYLQYTPLIEEQFYLIAPAASDVARQSRISMSAALDLPLIMPAEKHGLRELMEREALKLNKPLNLAFEVNAWPLMTDLVKRELGYTVLSYASVHEMVARGDVAAVPIVNPHLYRALAIVTPKDLPPSLATLKLAEIIREQVRLQVNQGLWRGRPLFIDTELQAGEAK